MVPYRPTPAPQPITEYQGRRLLRYPKDNVSWYIVHVCVKRYTLELYNDYSDLALYKFFDFHSCLNVDI